MTRNLSIDSKQVNLGDDSTLTLEVSKVKEPGSLNEVFDGKSIYVLFDNLSNEQKGLIEYGCEIRNGRLLLTEQGRFINDLFRRITPLTTAFDLVEKQTSITIPWQIITWDTPGTYAIDAFIGESRQQLDPALVRRGDQTVDFGTIKLAVMEERADVISVSMREASRAETPDQLLWLVIRNRALDFNRYRAFMDLVMCSDRTDLDLGKYRDYAEKQHLPFNRAASYGMLKAATEFYLMQEAGLVPSKTSDFGKPISKDPVGDAQRTGRSSVAGVNVFKLRNEYLDDLEGDGARALPYFKIIRQKLAELPLKKEIELPFDSCYGILQSRLTNPPLLELIWSYFHEEGGLVQTMNALSLRFQNVRRGVDRDPLANLAIDPLRPLSNLMWGYIEDERNRLTINRRNLEYQYEYGISLIGKAIQNIPVAEHRTNFLRGFHELLRSTTEFYQQANFTTVIPDGFPILNHLREVHLMLAEGAHNQYGDLPWVARVEMLTQQWILARPEVREFLGGRIMVPYTEPWMDRVDNMKQLQGWNPTNITHFRDLGVFGEQLLLSIRYGSWNDPTLGGQNAANWAHYWRAEIQRYIHAYKAVTGVDLASDIVDTRISLPANEDRYQQPSQLIERQMAMRPNGQARPRQVNGPPMSGQLSTNGQAIRRGYND